MVTSIPAAGAARDVFLAAGAGFLLGAAYRALRAVLGNSRAACFVCDALLLALGALTFRSAAASAFTAGVMRWYTGAAMALFALWSLRLLRGVSRWLHASLCAPFGAVSAIFRRFWNIWAQKRKRRKKKTRPRHLKKTMHVLYNSK